MNMHMLKSKLKEGEAALIISEENREYFTSFRSSSGYLIVTSTSSVFLTDSRYIEAAKNSITECDDVQLHTNLGEQLCALFGALQVKTVLLEAARITVADFARYQSLLTGVEVTATGELDRQIDALRAVKTKEEKEQMIQAQRIAERAFTHILEFIKPGKTEREIALELDYFMLRSGASAISFETIVVSGKNSSKPHGVPSEKKIEIGDFVTMDFGACFGAYHSDMTRTIAIGDIHPKQAQIYEIVLEAQLAALSVVRAGADCRACDFAARSTIEEAGYGEAFGHGTGHSVGIELHENPVLTPSSKEILQVGNVVTVEPGIYLENEFGVRIEDMVFVTEDGHENLTNSPKALMVL